MKPRKCILCGFYARNRDAVEKAAFAATAIVLSLAAVVLLGAGL